MQPSGNTLACHGRQVPILEKCTHPQLPGKSCFSLKPKRWQKKWSLIIKWLLQAEEKSTQKTPTKNKPPKPVWTAFTFSSKLIHSPFLFNFSFYTRSVFLLVVKNSKFKLLLKARLLEIRGPENYFFICLYNRLFKTDLLILQHQGGVGLEIY